VKLELQFGGFVVAGADLGCYGSNTGPCSCEATALSLSYIPSPRVTVLLANMILTKFISNLLFNILSLVVKSSSNDLDIGFTMFFILLVTNLINLPCAHSTFV
jgi:hypothetical protein